jgi:hypothetical protein
MPGDWLDWHEPYDDPGSALSGRLRRVQEHLRAALDRQPPARSPSSACARARAGT